MSIKRIIALLLIVVTVALTLMACGGGEETPCTHESVGTDGVCTECGEQVREPDAPPATDGSLELIKDGKASFKVVVGKTGMSASARVNEFVEAVNELLAEDGKTEKVDDYPTTVGDIEIIIGSVSTRGDEYTIDEHYLGYKGYEIKIIGNKLVVLAGDASMYTKAIDYLEEEIFGITKTTKSLDSLTVTEDDCVLVETTYKIKSAKIANNALDEYVFAIDMANADHKALATSMQSAIYKTIGAWCEVVSIKSVKDEKLAIKLMLVENDRVSDGFRAFVAEDGDLVIEGMYPEKFVDAAEDFLTESIVGTTKDKVEIKASLNKTANHRDIRYSDFGAKGNGTTNDFDAIYKTHEYANEWGHTVVGDSGANYYIDLTKDASGAPRTAIIKTNVDWTGVTFTIDDSAIDYNSPERSTVIFKVASEYSVKTYKPDGASTVSAAIAALNANAENNGNVAIDAESCTKLDLGLGYPALLIVWNENHYNYIREGSHYEGGNKQKELVLVDENGNIDENTPFMYDYTEITRIEVIRIDDAALTVKGGTFKTVANLVPLMFAQDGTTPVYYYYKRNIVVSRSNTVLDGITHVIEGENPEFGAPYEGFFSISRCNNVITQNCTVQAHRNYSGMGSYDLSPSEANNITYKNVVQSNFFIEDGVTPSVGHGWWGVMGSNYCKNLTYDHSRLTRFDAHCGAYNAKIINGSEVADLTLIGKGDFIIEDSKIYTDYSNELLTLRADYGATWVGDMYFKNVTAVYNNTSGNDTFKLISGAWTNHDFGYACGMPTTVTVDNFKVELSGGTTAIQKVVLAGGTITSGDISDDVAGATQNKNPYTLTEAFTVKNNEAGYKYSVPSTWNGKTELIIVSDEE